MELKLTNLTKNYGSLQALCEFSTTLTPGIYGLLGPNGAGKTTLMSIIAGLREPDSGSVTFDGEDTIKMGRRFRDVLGYMPQQQNLYTQFSAMRFLRYMASLKGLDRKEAAERILHLLNIVGLTDVAHRRLGGFSGGMKQRVLIAQALLNDPKVLLMDEPTAGLDPQERIRIRNFISEIAFDKIVLLATHVVPDVEYIANKIIMISHGQKVAVDTPANILKQMQGKVYELSIQSSELDKVRAAYKICNISKDSTGVTVRVVSDNPPEGLTAVAVKPSIEDAYLYMVEG